MDTAMPKIKDYNRLIRVWWPLRHKTMFAKSNIRFFIKQIRNLKTSL